MIPQLRGKPSHVPTTAFVLGVLFYGKPLKLADRVWRSMCATSMLTLLVPEMRRHDTARCLLSIPTSWKDAGPSQLLNNRASSLDQVAPCLQLAGVLAVATSARTLISAKADKHPFLRPFNDAAPSL